MRISGLSAMRISLLASLLFGLSLVAQPSRASTADNLLFRPASQIPVPASERIGASFIEMDRAKFESLASWKDFLCLIPDFPLGQDGLHNLRVEQFDAVSRDIKGKFPVPAHVFFRGSVDGLAGSHVCLTIYADRAWGYINAGEKTYVIAAVGRTETGNLILGVAIDTTSAANFTCGTDEWRADAMSQTLRQKIASAGHTSTPLGFGDSIPQFSVGLEMDYPCVQRLGGTDTGAFKYGLAVLAAASDIYLRDAGIALVCISHKEWDQQDPYYSDTVCDVLDEFDGRYLPATPPPSMYVLFSGRASNWCGGRAYGIGVLCDPTSSRCVCSITKTIKATGWYWPYSSWTWDIMVCAHETGHLVACPHTFNCLWNPPLDSCVQAEGGDCYFAPVPSKGTIMSYCHTTSAGAVLRFHPRCGALIQQQVSTYSCQTMQAIPVVYVLPARHLQTCSPTATFTTSASHGAAPYLFEINPAPSSSTVNGNSCTFTLKPVKPGTFYIRITDANDVRIYDSVILSPGTFSTSVSEDSLPADRDSVLLTATATDTTGATCVWSILPTFGRTIGSGWHIVIPRDTVPARYRAKVASGICIAYDTVTVSAKMVASRAVAAIMPAQFRIFPNPAHDRLTAILPTDGSRLWIEDALGRRVDVPESRASLSTAGVDAEQIDFELSTLPAGTYWLVRDASGAIRVSSFQKW
jgi:hypothetical protein